MIRVLLKRDRSGSIRSFSVEGHAEYGEYGQDIVCAGVSAITVGTVNAAEALLGVSLECEMKDGLLQASVPRFLEGDKPEKLQLLLESMVVMLRSIEESYGDYIVMKEK